MTAAITPELLRSLLCYYAETGKLFWRARDRSHFPTQRAWSSWNARYASREAFLTDNGYGYRAGIVFNQHFAAHRVIWAMVYGAWPIAEVDHINCIRSDNRLANLRAATPSQNRCNRPVGHRSSTGVKGVSWDRSRGKWVAFICLNGKRRNLGRFVEIADAANAYAEASRQIHGAFGRTA